MAWIYLMIASIFEIGFTTCLKLSDNFTKPTWIGSFVFFSVLSLAFLNKAVQTIPMGTAYAIWTGLGAVGTILVGIFLHGEVIDFWRGFFLSTLILSVLGLKFLVPE
ncbi:DMT family transporter [Leptospira noguchii]|uniref:Guanidinium exporter n=4 Tax=Leptospira noguchii TaxID=28182 RepID=M6VF96_9LEPT|nr:multidrug efflux SMR transporter [Leptospira noguchii]EMO25056.1 multidrug resistance protein, SMR family [Leptospira interrogans serovar Bataviae str. HAI135]EKR74505.1 multidrug resistance protein, SMR family [Leptospira noguchii str. 2006001870]EMI66389.1 multidrug resistance protein, SMR family [Leptospira noguchii str. Bonito]EMN01602.1 multidrug resistance protein, SMR family [Leptospira noguchii str. 2007001578]EMO39330.1 multidrug resistance protein, SMR family [Leptospira noguchii 